MRKRKNIDWAEFRGNYSTVQKGDVVAVIAAYRERRLRRADLRVFAGTLEAKALHKRSRVSLYRIVNTKSKARGLRRLSGREIDEACERVGRAIRRPSAGAEGLSGRFELQALIPRIVARHIAQGRCTCNEAILMLFYCLRRVKQGRELARLEQDQRYARFTYGELEDLSGVPRANLCRALKRLKARGFLSTREVAKQNENRYGLLFVDGFSISLTRAHRIRTERVEETTTPSRGFNNASTEESTTLRKKDPRNIIPEGKGEPLVKISWANAPPHMVGIVQRAQAMLDESLGQAA